MPECIRVLIADDHTVVRGGLRLLLGTDSRMNVVGEAADGCQAIAQARALQPDVILMDLAMPKKDGIQATAEILAVAPQIRILVLTSLTDDDRIVAAIQAGASGYLLKETSCEQLLQSIWDCYHDQLPLQPEIARKLVRASRRPSAPDAVLSPREIDVLRLVAQGLSNQEIAEKLVLSERTVRGHVSNILEKLNLPNRTQAALYAVREGLAPATE